MVTLLRVTTDLLIRRLALLLLGRGDLGLLGTTNLLGTVLALLALLARQFLNLDQTLLQIPVE